MTRNFRRCWRIGCVSGPEADSLDLTCWTGTGRIWAYRSSRTHRHQLRIGFRNLAIAKAGGARVWLRFAISKSQLLAPLAGAWPRIVRWPEADARNRGALIFHAQARLLLSHRFSRHAGTLEARLSVLKRWEHPYGLLAVRPSFQRGSCCSRLPSSLPNLKLIAGCSARDTARVRVSARWDRGPHPRH